MKIRHRYYKISIQIGPVRIVNNSKVYDIKEGKSTILPGLIYSLPTLLFGWWGFRLFRAISESTEALGTNFSGGEDITKSISESNYDDDTNYIWNNLLRQTTERISKDDLEIILSFQYEFIEKNPLKVFKDANVEFLLVALKKLSINNVDKEVLEDFFNTLKMFESNSE